MVPSFKELLFLHTDVCIRCHRDILAAHFSFIYSFVCLVIHHTNSNRNFWKQDVRLDGVGKIQMNPTRALSQLLTVTRWADHCKWKLTEDFLVGHYGRLSFPRMITTKFPIPHSFLTIWPWHFSHPAVKSMNLTAYLPWADICGCLNQQSAVEEIVCDFQG